MLKCQDSYKHYPVINCAFSAQSLKFAVGGGQGKLYLQPIQNKLVKKIQESETSAVKQKCRFCNDEMYVIAFSDHLKEYIKVIYMVAKPPCSI